MGRPKVKIIDDSVQEEEVKEKPSKKVEKSAEEKSEADSSPVITNETKQSPAKEEKKEAKKAKKPGKAKPRSKKYQELVTDLDKTKNYPLSEAIDLIKKLSYSKFEGTLEAHINTSTTGIRGLVSLPFTSGRKLRIVAFGNGAETSGADVAGTDETIENINKGKVDFDIIVTTPAWMSKLAKVARILGPRGLMPNPKNGTITDDLKKAVEGFQAGKTEYKTESKAPVIHMALGKVNQPTEQLSANIKTLLQTLGKTRVKKVTLSPTMGPSVKLDLTSL